MINNINKTVFTTINTSLSEKNYRESKTYKGLNGQVIKVIEFGTPILTSSVKVSRHPPMPRVSSIKKSDYFILELKRLFQKFLVENGRARIFFFSIFQVN